MPNGLGMLWCGRERRSSKDGGKNYERQCSSPGSVTLQREFKMGGPVGPEMTREFGQCAEE